MKTLTSAFFILVSFSSLVSFAQCDEADHQIFLSNFEFYPSELTIVPGESVAFINIEGTHSVNGINNTVTGEYFNNPSDFFIDQTTATPEGVCMDSLYFELPGVYNFDCSVGYNAQAGMNLTITVDAFDLNDLFIQIQADQTLPIFQSQYAFQSFAPSYLSDLGPWTLFVPDDDAVTQILDYMNLNQFDALGIPDFPEIMEYHIAEGLWLEEDLYNGLELTSAQGQPLYISQTKLNTSVNNATITSTNYTAFNGVIHVIDYCLAPQGLPESTVMQLIANSPDHEILEDLLIAANLDDDLSAQVIIDESINGPGPFTIFAPTDAAFEGYMEDLGWSIDDLVNSQFIYQILNNHLVNGVIDTAQMYTGLNLANSSGIFLNFELVDNNISVSGNLNSANIISPDLRAYNGLVHSVDKVIKPELPVVAGDCGIWRLQLQGSANLGWGGSLMYILVNDNVLDTVTIYEGNGPVNYEFGVDVGDVVDLIYSPDGAGGNSTYKLFDQNNSLIVQSTGNIGFNSNNCGTPSIIGIEACSPMKEYCEEITINQFNDYGYGWVGGKLRVYRNNLLEKSLNMYTGYCQTTKMYVDYNDTLDFIVSGSPFPEENGFQVFDGSNQIIIDDNVFNEAPDDYLDIPVCINIPPSWDCLNDMCVESEDGSGVFSSLYDCYEVCTNSSELSEEKVQVEIYPNPSHDKFNLILPNNKNAQILLADFLGNIVYRKKIHSTKQLAHQIDLSNYSKGVYSLSVLFESEQKNYKLILQ